MQLSFLFLLLVTFIKLNHALSTSLVEAVEAAFIKKDNLINLMNTFYPPYEIQPDRVQLEIRDITVQYIADEDFDHYNHQYSYPAFDCDYAECRYDGDIPIFYDIYVFEDEKSYSKLLAFINSGTLNVMALFDILSYRLYATLAFFQPQYTYTYNDILDISLSIDSLESMPSKSDFNVAMEMGLSWVN